MPLSHTTCVWWLIALLVICGQVLGYWRRRPDWNRCGCYWGSWESWSDCTQSCYGYRKRERWVHYKESKYCSHGHEVCHPPRYEYFDGEWDDWDDCNAYCPYGSRSGSGRSKYCSCPRGRYGTCCTYRASCGSPSSVSNGRYSYSGTYHDDTVTYYCYSDYKMVGGSSTRTCHVSWGYQHGSWSGSTPRCLFARTCRSNPCQNGARCQDLIERYRCHCRSGWAGVQCERDVQPPLVRGCPSHISIKTSQHLEKVTWKKPTFYDPHGFEVRVSSNYDNAWFEFPWGDFTVQYYAYKPNNGMRANCVFNVKVRPHPCPPLPAPTQGMIVCNGWQSEMGQFCLVSCLHGLYLPLGYDPEEWHVCGASGRWSAGLLASQCLDKHHTKPVSLLPQPKTCQDSAGLDDVRQEFVRELNASYFGQVFCQDMGSQCRPGNVHVLCKDG